ncbi:hypothetical protein ANN_09075 [Periplaneta americana]|uniref:DUF4781 domain-containing protein n=1 Tax=Periplaneta americana TaxID=6978 RepID=A0ABQ8TKE1_PERAM|nr:hypothetical protein ANN_09075 [Periplaneta americana]
MSCIGYFKDRNQISLVRVLLAVIITIVMINVIITITIIISINNNKIRPRIHSEGYIREEKQTGGGSLQMSQQIRYHSSFYSSSVSYLQYSSYTEYADIVYVYGLCDGSSLRAVAEYERRFPNRRVPYRRVFTVYEDYASISHKSVEETVELHWNSPTVEGWKTEAREEQQNFYEMLGGDQMTPGTYGNHNRADLERKIAYAMYGPPPELPNPKLNSGTGYMKKQLKIVRKLCSKILKIGKNSNTSVSFLFICINVHEQHLVTSVFNIPTENSDAPDLDIYVDNNRRIYRGWHDYLKNNKLPRCFMCYPRKGKYTATDKKVDVDFGESPAYSLPLQVFNALDITTSLVATALAITALALPVSMPVAIAAAVGGVASGVFGLSRSAKTLIDRHKHGQTLGLNSEEARNNWLGVVVGASTVKGLTIVEHFAEIGMKLEDEEEVTALDAFQLVSSIFFFTGSVVSTQSAFGALRHLKAVRLDMKMAHVLRVVQSKDALRAEIIAAGKTWTDGGDDQIEEPEMVWPPFEEHF